MSSDQDDQDGRSFRDTVRGVREMLLQSIVIEDQLGAAVRGELGELALQICTAGVDAVRLRIGDEAFDTLVAQLATVTAYHQRALEFRDEIAAFRVGGMPLREAMDLYAPPEPPDQI
jgi:hypothetical protein